MKNKSIWLDEVKVGGHKKIDKDMTVDILIIGGGMTGLTTAYHLINSNLKVCVVEKNLIGEGVSARTTGKLTYLQDNIYTKLQEKGDIYYKSQKEAIKIVSEIIKNNNIECDFTKVKSYLYTNQAKEISKIKEEENMLRQLKIDYKKYDKLPIQSNCKYAISVDDTYVFHPIKYLNSLKNIVCSKGIEIYENSSVIDIKKNNEKYMCKVNDKIITAKKVVIASHYPYFLYPYFMPLKTYIEKSYVSASLIDKTQDFSAITVSKPINSMRYHSDKKNNYFIFLNSTHNLCTKYDDKDNFNNLENELANFGLKADYIWSNHDVMTEDNLPYIGFIDDNLLIGTGYNTWGMTNGNLAGKILSDLILKGDNQYKDLFDPKRNKQLKNIIKYPLYMSYSAKSFVENKIIKNKDWYKERVAFTKIDGKNVAIYTDENNVKHIVYNLCPHLKCSLIFNEVEHTWDCPCHGSRFDIDGKCIVGPSNIDIGFKNDDIL